MLDRRLNFIRWGLILITEYIGLFLGLSISFHQLINSLHLYQLDEQQLTLSSSWQNQTLFYTPIKVASLSCQTMQINSSTMKFNSLDLSTATHSYEFPLLKPLTLVLIQVYQQHFMKYQRPPILIYISSCQSQLVKVRSFQWGRWVTSTDQLFKCWTQLYQPEFFAILITWLKVRLPSISNSTSLLQQLVSVFAPRDLLLSVDLKGIYSRYQCVKSPALMQGFDCKD